MGGKVRQRVFATGYKVIEASQECEVKGTIIIQIATGPQNPVMFSSLS